MTVGAARARRPALLLLGPDDHVEAGSTIRSAAAFGWSTVGLDDRRCDWFGAPRAAVAEERAAARSHRNAIRVAPMPAAGHLGSTGPWSRARGWTVSCSTAWTWREDGARCSACRTRTWSAGRTGNGCARVELARVPLPVTTFPYRYRLVASIVLAEAARQVGVSAGGRPRPVRPRSLTHESVIDSAAPGPAEAITFQQLRAY
jgi:hypothetical protein